MHFRPTIRQLSFLVALAEHKSFSRAADTLNVAQSTLSAGIKELEAVLGAPLVERTKRLVRLTGLGREVVRRAQAILTETDDLVDLVKGAVNPFGGEVRLGAIPTIGPFLLPKALPVLKKKYPGLKLFLREGQTEDILGRLKKGTLDVGLLAFPYPIPGLEKETLGDDNFVLVCPKGDPLARKRIVSVSDLDQSRLLLLEEGHCLRDHALSFCQIHNLKAAEQFKATSLETLVLMVAEGLGITFVPEIAVRAGLLKGKNVESLRLKNAGPGRTIGLCWRASNPRGKQFLLLAGELKGLL